MKFFVKDGYYIIFVVFYVRVDCVIIVGIVSWLNYLVCECFLINFVFLKFVIVCEFFFYVLFKFDIN